MTMKHKVEELSEEELEAIENGVELIASGYEWTCPSCERYNHEIEVTESVTCRDCKRTFEVADYYHAIG